MITMDDLLEKQRGKCQPRANDTENVRAQQDTESNSDDDVIDDCTAAADEHESEDDLEDSEDLRLQGE